jgi:aquaporin Z
MELIKIIVEILGTFFFVSVILQSIRDKSIGPVAIAAALLGAIYFGASTSKAHFNPAVSFGMFMHKQIEYNELISYILAQLVGAALAVKFLGYIPKVF